MTSYNFGYPGFPSECGDEFNLFHRAGFESGIILVLQLSTLFAVTLSVNLQLPVDFFYSGQPIVCILHL
jgi:hypothetical protein